MKSNPFAALSVVDKSSLRLLEELLPVGFRSTVGLDVGTKLIRPVNFYNTGRKEILDPQFAVTETGSSIIRGIQPSYEYPTNNLVAVANRKKSLVAFCSSIIPHDWIYFEVTSFSKSRKAVFVKVISGTPEDLYALYNTEGANRELKEASASS